MEEQPNYDFLPVAIFLGYFAVKFVHHYSYYNYNSLYSDLYYEINGNIEKLDKSKLIRKFNIKPLECGHNILNLTTYFDTTDSETDSNDEIVNDDATEDVNDNVNDNATEVVNDDATEVVNDDANDDVNDNVNNDVTEVVNDVDDNNDIIKLHINNEYNVFLMSNYKNEMNATNNPFYNNLNLVFDVLIKKIENKKLDKYLEELKHWKLEDIDDYYKLEIVDNHIPVVFDNLFKILNNYYDNIDNINFIFNNDDFCLLKKYILKQPITYNFINNIPMYKYMNFSLLNIYDLYGFINSEKKNLDYNNIDFKKIDELKEFYHLETLDLESSYTNEGSFISFLNKFY
jgi:hypothetical protein